jgi:hypothetical protein
VKDRTILRVSNPEEAEAVGGVVDVAVRVQSPYKPANNRVSLFSHSLKALQTTMVAASKAVAKGSASVAARSLASRAREKVASPACIAPPWTTAIVPTPMAT